MEQFNYTEQLQKLIKPEIISALSVIREYRGKQAAYEATRPDTFKSLVEIAKIQSVNASNRIENISTSDKRLRALMAGTTEPKNRDEREIAGYRYVLDMIHESHDDIPINANVILQLHRDLYRFCDDSFSGKWKDADNVIAERSENGELVARFKPTSAAATPVAIEKICTEYQAQIKANTYDPMLVSLMFAFDFVGIHPFNDGNGRMSRLLTLLLMYRSGYTVGKYISIEKEIERSKETYYEALTTSSTGWSDGNNDYVPFITYMLGVITACYKELDQRLQIAGSTEGNEKVLRIFFSGLLGAATKQEILDANPSMSKRTVERLLKKFQEEGLVEKTGAARSTAYRRVNS